MKSSAWDGDWPITQPFGCTDLLVEPYWHQAQCHWHCGVDIGMPKGTGLYAVRAGTVIYSGYGLFGIGVGNEVDWYVHGDYYSPPAGQAVAQGFPLGFSGDKIPSGGSLTGPHLHFERQGGSLNVPATSLDPIPVLTAGAFGGGGGTLGGDDMTPDEHNVLVDIQNKLVNIDIPNLMGLRTDVGAIRDQILGAINGIPAGNVAPVLAAIADLKAHPATADPAVLAIVTKLEKAFQGA